MLRASRAVELIATLPFLAFHKHSTLQRRVVIFNEQRACGKVFSVFVDLIDHREHHCSCRFRMSCYQQVRGKSEFFANIEMATYEQIDKRAQRVASAKDP